MTRANIYSESVNHHAQKLLVKPMNSDEAAE